MSRAVACRKEKWIARQSFPLEFTAVHVTSLICSCPRFTHFPLLLASKSTPVNMDRLLDPTAHHVRVHLSTSCIEIGARPPHALLFFQGRHSSVSLLSSYTKRLLRSLPPHRRKVDEEAARPTLGSWPINSFGLPACVEGARAPREMTRGGETPPSLIVP